MRRGPNPGHSDVRGEEKGKVSQRTMGLITSKNLAWKATPHRDLATGYKVNVSHLTLRSQALYPQSLWSSLWEREHRMYYCLSS